MALLCACNFTVTREAPTYDELPAADQRIVDRILANLQRFHDAVEDPTLGGPGIDTILDRDAVQVHFRGLVLAANLGDGAVRVSTWERLDGDQRERIASWWAQDSLQASDAYPKLFYDYVATHLAALEWIYLVQGVQRVLDSRPRFNVERDAQRLTVATYAERDPRVLDDVARLCGPMRAQYDERWSAHYDSDTRESGHWFGDHIAALADPALPTGFFYYFCRWFEDARARAASLLTETELVKSRFCGNGACDGAEAQTCPGDC
ncbi:MAG: hypothetical protein AABZ30_16380 [Myxococcota bacterium]